MEMSSMNGFTHNIIVFNFSIDPRERSLQQITIIIAQFPSDAAEFRYLLSHFLCFLILFNLIGSFQESD